MDKFNEMFTAIESRGWYSRLEDLEEDLTEAGFEVLEMNREYVVVSYVDTDEWVSENDEDVQVQIKLGGTENTITIDEYEEIYRG